MRKILLSIIIVLFLALGYVSLKNGIHIGDMQILSIEQIGQKSQELKTKIDDANQLIEVNYPQKITELTNAEKQLQQSEEEYYKYTNISSDEEILNAMEQKSYTIEFLWANLGTHARKQGVTLTFEIVSSSAGINGINDIKFTVNGSYIAVTNFIYAIENDTDLNFRIQNFKLLPYQGEILQGTFMVKNVKVQGNTSTQSVNATSSQNTQNDTKNQNDTQNQDKGVNND